MKDTPFTADRLLALYDRVAEAEDAIPRLRRFVLDLAVRGKLVAQDPSDEPAAELLKRIAKEKARLVKAGGLRSSKVADPAMVDAPFDLPFNWAWAAIGTVFIYDAGDKRDPKELDRGLWLLELEDLEKDTGRLLERMTVDQRASQSMKSQFRAGDILYGKLRPYLNKVLVADEPGYSTTEIVALRPYLPLCSSYCALALRRPDFVEYVTRLGQGTKMPRLRTEDAIVAPFPLPPLAEQQRIVAKVEELMALCDRLEAARAGREAVRDRLTAATWARLTAPETDAEALPAEVGTGSASGNATTKSTFPTHARAALQTLPNLTNRPDQIKTLRQTILNLAVRGKLVAQEPTDEPAVELLKRIREWQRAGIAQKEIRAPRKPLMQIGEGDQPYPLPKGWAYARLGEIIYIQSGDGLTAANMKDGPYPVFGGNGINGHHDCYNVQKPTLVIGRVGYYCGSVHLTPENAWVTDNAFITHFSEKEVSLNFLVLLLNSTNLKEDENATAQPVISGSKIYPIVVGLPPLAEQHRIVAKVDALMALCDQLESSLTTATTTRSRLLEALLHEALGGAPGDQTEAAA